MRILVAEDEFLVAWSLEDMLANLGCDVVGPFASTAAVRGAAADDDIDGALLDINLGGETVFSAAEALYDQGIPIVFCSGYADISMMPDRLRTCPRIAKPYTEEQVREAVALHFDTSRQKPPTSGAQGGGTTPT